ncbi:MAG: M48 family metallopeptidase [Bdellovibrionota bacterium]
MLKINKILSLISSVFLFTACATSPTGRKQLQLLPDSQMNSMGVASFNEMKKTEKISNDKALNARVKCVVEALLNRNGMNPSEWEIKVFEDDTLNAFALPGKKIGVHTGIFKAAQNQNQLAAVLGHEIGHVIAKHGNERVSQQLLVQGGMTAAQLSVDQNSTTGKAVLAGLGLGASVGILLPFSRAHESEADEMGVRYMANAGFDPEEAITLWSNMQAQSKGSGPQFLSTHPDPSNRRKKIGAMLPEADKLQMEALNKYNPPECY